MRSGGVLAAERRLARETDGRGQAVTFVSHKFLPRDQGARALRGELPRSLGRAACARAADDPAFDRECFSGNHETFESSLTKAATDPMTCGYPASDYGGAVHPTAEGHAAMADAALPVARQALGLPGRTRSYAASHCRCQICFLRGCRAPGASELVRRALRRTGPPAFSFEPRNRDPCHSIRTLRPSVHPHCCRPFRNAARRACPSGPSAATLMCTPMRRIGNALLCPRRDGPRRRAAEERDELASLHR
jgi:hypothetical protein